MAKQHGWRVLLVAAVLVLGAGLLLLTTVGSDEEPAPGSTSQTGEVTLRAGDRVVVVSLDRVQVEGSTVSAQLAPGSPAGVRVRAFGLTDQGFRVVLGKPAPAQVTATWTATGLEPGSSTSESVGAVDLLQLGLLALAGLVVLFAAFLLTHVSGTGALLFAAFARVGGLLLTAGLGLLAAVLASRSDDPEPFTALFTLLGIVAGYLAGTKTESQKDTPGQPAPSPGSAGEDGRSSTGPSPSSAPGTFGTTSGALV